MRRVVLDASALLSWFDAVDSRGPLRAEYEHGLLNVVAPRELTTHVIGALAVSRDWPADRLVRVAAEVDRLGFELRQPPIDEVAAWLARGLDAEQAGYAALASSLDITLVTADPTLLRLAATVARSPTDG